MIIWVNYFKWIQFMHSVNVFKIEQMFFRSPPSLAANKNIDDPFWLCNIYQPIWWLIDCVPSTGEVSICDWGSWPSRLIRLLLNQQSPVSFSQGTIKGFKTPFLSHGSKASHLGSNRIFTTTKGNFTNYIRSLVAEWMLFPYGRQRRLGVS